MLRAIDHKKVIRPTNLWPGAYQFGTYVLVIDHVQGDPFASHPPFIWKFPGSCLDSPKNCGIRIVNGLRCRTT